MHEHDSPDERQAPLQPVAPEEQRLIAAIQRLFAPGTPAPRPEGDNQTFAVFALL